MKKQQLILLSGGLVLLVLLYFFGNTTPPTNLKANITKDTAEGATATITSVLEAAKKKLTPSQSETIAQLENSVVRGNVKEQQIHVYTQMALYWQDTLQRPDIGAYYLGESAKLENSEKSLSFAARLLLNQLMAETDPAMMNWLATNAKALFEKVLQINPGNDSAKVELGACYIFGNISSSPMEGISKIKEVADKDANNMYAQLMLGLGDIRSQQYDKAIERLGIVAEKEPGNLQALFNLAETYERKGDKQNAIKWYKRVESMINLPEAKQEIENRINSLQ